MLLPEETAYRTQGDFMDRRRHSRWSEIDVVGTGNGGTVKTVYLSSDLAILRSWDLLILTTLHALVSSRQHDLKSVTLVSLLSASNTRVFSAIAGDSSRRKLTNNINWSKVVCRASLHFHDVLCCLILLEDKTC